MAESYLELTAGDLCDAVEALTGDDTTGAALPYVQAGYMRFLAGLDPRTGRAHDWSFLRPVAELTITATASAVNTNGVYDGDADTTAVTAASALFYPFHEGLTITVADVGDLTISTYTDSTHVTVAGGEDWSTKGTTVPHRGLYDLPGDYDGQVEPFVAIYAGSGERCPLIACSPSEVFAAWRQSNVAGDTYQYAVMAADLSVSASQGYVVAVAPRPDESMTWRYRYRRRALDITDSPSCYLLGGPAHSYTIRECCLAETEVRLGQKSGGVHAREADRWMAVSIDRDNRTTPTTIECLGVTRR